MKSPYFKRVYNRAIGLNHYFEVYTTSDDVRIRKLGFDFDFRRRTDHGGFHICFGFLGTALMIEFYDTRHWDKSRDCYYEKD